MSTEEDERLTELKARFDSLASKIKVKLGEIEDLLDELRSEESDLPQAE